MTVRGAYGPSPFAEEVPQILECEASRDTESVKNIISLLSMGYLRSTDQGFARGISNAVRGSGEEEEEEAKPSEDFPTPPVFPTHLQPDLQLAGRLVLLASA